MTVTGIGGIFFRARDPEALESWYQTHFGITGPMNGGWEQQAGTTAFSPFEADSDYFPKDKSFMINLRVDDLDALLERLRAAGIEIITNPDWDSAEFGRFARVHDLEGNPVELWQPA